MLTYNVSKCLKYPCQIQYLTELQHYANQMIVSFTGILDEQCLFLVVKTYINKHKNTAFY